MASPWKSSPWWWAVESSGERILIPGGELCFWPAAFAGNEAATLFERIREETPWEQSLIRIAGRHIPIPRLNAWYGDQGADYSYSGVRLETRGWTATLRAVKHRVERLTGHGFNSALLNLYRNERDNVDWHSDDEPELGARPIVASVSLGEQRSFELRRRDEPRRKFSLALPDGSLLLMAGELQQHWQHRVAKERQPCGERINITFRTVHNTRS